MTNSIEKHIGEQSPIISNPEPQQAPSSNNPSQDNSPLEPSETQKGNNPKSN